MLKKVERLTLRTAARVRDIAFPGSWLYSTDQRIEGLPPCRVPDTHYVIHTRYAGEGKPAEPFLMQMLSMAPDGLRRGWDVCGGCSNYITSCACQDGVTPPHWVKRSLQIVDPVAEAPPALDPVLRRRLELRDYGPHPTGMGTVLSADPVPTTMAELDTAAVESSEVMKARLRKRLLS